MSGAEVLRRLQSKGWRIVRTRGSHHLMQKGKRVVPVPVHGKTEIGIGLLKALEKQTGEKLK